MKGLGRCKRAAKRKSEGVNNRERLEFAEEIQGQRASALMRWYSEGGSIFQIWSQKHYRTSDGRPLTWEEPFMEELYIFIGHPWFVRKIVEKAAQVGFTEALIAYAAFCLAFLHIPVGFGAETRDKINLLVGNRIQTAFDFIPAIQDLNRERQSLTKRKDSDNKKSISVGGVDIYFFYANMTGKGGMERQASGSLSSFTACTVLADEFELWVRGVLDIASKRMQASKLLTRPIIAGSTPGAEGGITASEVKLCNHILQWHFTCPHCQNSQFLSPLGNFLKAVEVDADGEMETRYIDPTGRPLDWFYRDEKNKISTAHIGCSSCGAELDHEAIATGCFRCTKTQVTLRDLVAQTTEQQRAIKRVAIRLPRLATSNFDAPEIIENLLTSDNPIDELQQGLGVPASTSLGRINYNRLLACVGLPLPEDFSYSQVVTVLSIDQGKFAHPAMVVRWYLPELPDRSDRWLAAHKQIIWYGELPNLDGAITAKAEEFDVDVTVMDSEPSYTDATTYASDRQPRAVSKNQVYLVDQVALKGEKYKRKLVKVSTEDQTDVILYNIDRTYALDRVRDRIYRRLEHLPEGLTYDPGDRKGNLLSHYLCSERLPDNRWLESANDHDHWFQCSGFAEIVALIDLFEEGHDSFHFTSIEIS